MIREPDASGRVGRIGSAGSGWRSDPNDAETDERGDGVMPACVTCGTHVSRQFARVFAPDDGGVHACPECSATAGIAQVAIDRLREGES